MKKIDFLSRLVTPTGTKGCASHVALAAPFVPVDVTNRDKRSSFVPVARPGTKEHLLLSRTGVPGWETGTTGVSQPGQINVFVVVILFFQLPEASYKKRSHKQSPLESWMKTNFISKLQNS